MTTTAHAPITAPTGTTLSCKGWHQEAALRMLMNNLDPAVAERPEELIVYGGGGKAARNWECYEQIVATLRRLENDETLLVQSGKPVGVFRTHEEAPRVLIANAHLVPRWATWDEFRRLDALGLTMYGQMTAGSWIYIGTQGILQGTYETFAECARQHFGGTLEGRLVVTGGLGGMGGAQPLAATMNGAAFLGVDVDESRIRRRVETRYCDRLEHDLDDGAPPGRGGARAPAAALRRAGGQHRRGAAGAGPAGRRARRAHRPDLGARPPRRLHPGRPLARRGGRAPRAAIRPATRRGCSIRWWCTCGPCSSCRPRAPSTFDYGNNLRGQVADRRGMPEAFDIPGFVPAFIRPLFCRGAGPVPLGRALGRPGRHRRDRPGGARDLSRRRTRWRAGSGRRRSGCSSRGCPARICWLEYGERAEMGLRFNWLVKHGKVRAPIVIGRDHLDTGSVASPNRETEGMKDGSDAIADWPLLNALLNTACGASWVSLHHGGGVGIGYSIHAGMVAVADGTADGRPAAGAGAHRRPRHRRHAARGRGLRAGDRDGAGAGGRPADGQR